jgi:hypothetical protein
MFPRALCIAQGSLGPRLRLLPAETPRPQFVEGKNLHKLGLPRRPAVSKSTFAFPRVGVSISLGPMAPKICVGA